MFSKLKFFAVAIIFSSILTAQEKKQTTSIISDQTNNSVQASVNEVNILNNNGNPIITITDEGSDAGSVTLLPVIPSDQKNKLYNIGGSLMFNGLPVAGGGATNIDELSDAKTGGASVFLGSNAGTNDDGTNNQNTGVGKGALSDVISGNFNVGVGYNSLQSTKTGDGNVGLGLNALFSNVGGNYNIGIGQGSNYYLTSGSNNIGIGFQANLNNGTGSNNTIIGHEAGSGTSNHNKSGNVFLGYQAGYNETGSNKLYIDNSNNSDPLIWGDFANDFVKINGSIEVTKYTTLSSLTIPTNATAGAVLTSDANGNASWQTISASSDNDWTINGNHIYSSSSGNVGIGITSPTDNDKLEIASSVNQDAFRIKVGTATKLRVFANGGTALGSNHVSGTPSNGLYVHGNVGLGVSNPTDKLEINGKVKTTQLQMTSGANNGHVLTSDASGNASWQSISTGDNDWLTNGLNIYSRTSGGNVGIGTAIPEAKLDVLGDIKARDIQLTTGATDGYVLTSDSDGNGTWQESSGGGVGADDDWLVSGSNILRIGGNVGIGANSPISKLSVGSNGISSAVVSSANYTTSGYAIYGSTWASGYGVGVYGTVNGAGANSESIAVYGDHSNGGIGVQGRSSGIGILGKISGTVGIAGRFEGPVEVTGKLSVGANPTLMAYQLAVDGSAAKSSGGTSWAVVSDRRLKDIKGDYNKGLSEIEKLNTIIFNYKNENPLNLPSKNTEYGFIAQEVQEIFPEAVSTMDNGYLDFNFHPIHVAMVNAVQQLSKKNVELEQKVESLTQYNHKLENVQNDNNLLKNELNKIKDEIKRISQLQIKLTSN